MIAMIMLVTAAFVFIALYPLIKKQYGEKNPLKTESTIGAPIDYWHSSSFCSMVDDGVLATRMIDQAKRSNIGPRRAHRGVL